MDVFVLSRYRLTITVKEIRGKCPVYNLGDTIVIEEPTVVIKRTSNLCIHSFASMLTMIVPLCRGVSFRELGLAGQEEAGYVQCLDPGPPFTPGGTVIFEILRENVT